MNIMDTKKLSLFVSTIVCIMVIATVNAITVSADSYIVKEGDTLWGIANEFETNIETLKSLNNIEDDIIIVGTSIEVPQGQDEKEQSSDEAREQNVDMLEEEFIFDNNEDETTKILYTADITCSLGEASYYNINLASYYLKDYVIYPGEQFSWERILGGNTYEQGYVAGKAYSGGQVVQSPGGGVCVLSTAIMQAARGAGMTITEKWPHSGYVSYAHGDDEAAVSYGSKDLKFYNNLSYPVKFEFEVTHQHTIVRAVRAN